MHVCCCQESVRRKLIDRRCWTIIYSHGNSQDLGMCLPFIENLAHQLKCNVVGYDYTGYGRNEGESSEGNSVEDLRDVCNYLHDNGITWERMVLMGHSLGGGVSISFASQEFGKWEETQENEMKEDFEKKEEKKEEEKKEKKIGGMIIISTFTSICGVISKYAGMVMTDMFENIPKLKHINIPVEVIHGGEDELIGVDESVEIYNSIPEEMRYGYDIINGCKHNDILENDELIKVIKRFLEKL
ncbi:hypothetical protein ENUP19_0157G0006 [Entamoeba nuttalli]|uniref:Serine aminopeptidase S33 domain-containing protein n=1 Tax=Entamoeba nuttalli TaxID=412467 RepID=A0ABQ0DLN1_9EUKA